MSRRLLQLHPSPGQDRPRRYLMQVCCKRRHITNADVSLMCRFVQLMCRLCMLHCGLCVSPASVCLNYISAVFLLKTPACRTDLLLTLVRVSLILMCRWAADVLMLCRLCATDVLMLCRLCVACVSLACRLCVVHCGH